MNMGNPNRRAILMSALGSGAFFLLPRISVAQGADTTGETTPFSYDILTDMARDLATRPWQAPDIPDADVLERIDYDQHNRIAFRKEHGLWQGQEGASPVHAFFPGRYFKNPVRLHTVQDGQAALLPFSLDMFDIPDDSPAQELTQTTGFAGFRVQDGKTEQDWMAFLGASYWRTSGYSGQFGLSVRGLAIDTAIPDGPEEFPNFTHFWLEPGENGDITAYALLDSPSATGAYRIASFRDNGVIQNVAARIFLRKDVERLGVAPLTSMFWFGKNTPHIAPDWRPEVHDSDGLEIVTGSGEQIWRPLNNPPRTMTNTFSAPSVKGFGLMQRERDFDQYQDDGVFYEKRASLWVEPGQDWGEGSVTLVELRTDDEIHDNIVAFWQPGAPATAGTEYDLQYRLSWVQDSPLPATTGHFIATRIGAGGVPGQPRPAETVKLVCDFRAEGVEGLTREDGVAVNATASAGTVRDGVAYPVVGTDYWRAMADLDFAGLPEDDDTPIDLRLFVEHGGAALTETLLMQLFPSQLRALLDSTP